MDKTVDIEPDIKSLTDLITLNNKVADAAEALGGRYFGNVSTRCEKLFPSVRLDDTFMLVSRRNVDKHRLTVDDFVKVKYIEDKIYYDGVNLPSVDTPIQAELYRRKPWINYVIHGHSYIKFQDLWCQFTENYYPCGDLREIDEICKIVSLAGGFNLKNHGFTIYSNSLESMKEYINLCQFVPRVIGKEKVEIYA